MARFHYRNPKSSGRFPTSPAKGTSPVRESAPPSHAAPPSFAGRAGAPHANPSRPSTSQGLKRPDPPQRRDGLGVVSPQTTDRWRELLTPDGTPPALPYQIDYVRNAVRQETGVRPSLRGLTVGQAERILAALNVDPRPLWHSGRDNWVMNVLAICGKWLAISLLFIVILALGRADGLPLILLILLWFGLSAARRQRRQAFENRYYRRALPDRRGSAPVSDDDEARPQAANSPESPASRGNPYDVETYLKRLDGDGR